jgi:hypothetical protein
MAKLDGVAHLAKADDDCPVIRRRSDGRPANQRWIGRRLHVATTAPKLKKAQSKGGSHHLFEGHCSHSL